MSRLQTLPCICPNTWQSLLPKVYPSFVFISLTLHEARKCVFLWLIWPLLILKLDWLIFQFMKVLCKQMSFAGLFWVSLKIVIVNRLHCGFHFQSLKRFIWMADAFVLKLLKCPKNLFFEGTLYALVCICSLCSHIEMHFCHNFILHKLVKPIYLLDRIFPSFTD